MESSRESMMDEEVTVEVVRERMVKPDAKALKLAMEAAGVEAECEMYLSANDVLCRLYPHVRRVLFYDPPPAESSMTYTEIVEHMAASLSSALATFFPLAGRLVGCDRRIRLALNAAGASLTEAIVKGVTIDDLRRLSFPVLPFFSRLSPSFPIELYASVPVLAVQISKFDCGGIAIGISHNHIVCDGTSIWHFITSWAECARGEVISMLPIHDRTLLKVNPSPNKAKLHMEYVEDEENNVDEDSEVKLKIFYFTKDVAQRLKKKVNGEFSSYEVICAHIWKHTSKARKHKQDKKVAFISITNMRNRLEPPLGDAYFGNAHMWTIATATTRELLDEDLTKTCERIHTSLTSCTNEAFHGWLQWLEVNDRDALFERCLLNGARLRASSSHNFPVFKVDFGWGKPCVVRCAKAEEVGKVVFFAGSDSSGDINVAFALPKRVMDQLENDDAFRNL